MENRGRFQAQGKRNQLEESEAWSQNEPLYINQGANLLNRLKNKIPPFEQKKREKAFQECNKFIQRASLCGGIEIVDKPLRKSFLRNETERADLEVLKGKAFVMSNENDK